MTTPRKKWDLSGPIFTDFYSPNVDSSSSDSYFDIEDNSKSASKSNVTYRSPLVEIHQNIDVNMDSNKQYPEKRRTKSCPRQFYDVKSEKKKSIKIGFPYNLRKTPERISRILKSSLEFNESTKFIDANENLHGSPLIPEPNIRILRNRSMQLTSTVKKTSKNRVSFAEVSPSSKRISFIVTDSSLNFTEHDDVSLVFADDEDAMANKKPFLPTPVKYNSSEVFHTPQEQLQISSADRNSSKVNCITRNDVLEGKSGNISITHSKVFSENSEQFLSMQTPDEESEDNSEKRGSYTVTDSKFNPCDLPHTPAVRKSPRLSGNNSLTSEDPSIFKINYVNRRSIKRTSIVTKKYASKFAPRNKISAVRRKTVCQPFHLVTEERYPKRETNSSIQERSFNSMLRRNNTPKTSAQSRRITKVSPFNLTTSRKRLREEYSPAYVPLAERVAAHFKTPTRFRSSSRLTVFKQPEKQPSPEFVRPKTPKLNAVKRRRTVNILSHEQQLDLEAKQIREYRFRAKPFNPNLRSRPSIVRDTKKPSTIPEEFHLETEKRFQERKCMEKSIEEPKYEFKARKVPKYVLDGPVKTIKQAASSFTLPKSPKLSLKNREVKWKNFYPMDKSPEVFHFKAAPAPVYKSPALRKSQPKSVTTVQPFSFHEKDKIRLANKEKKIQEELEQKYQSFKFHASDVPSTIKRSKLPDFSLEKKPLTVPQPFNLHPNNFPSRYSSSRNHSDFEIPRVSHKTSFKAKDATVLKKKPFIPQKNLPHVIDCVNFHLHTEDRAIEWERMKEERMSAEKEKEIALQQCLLEQEQKEKEEIRQLRQELVHIAQPIRKYKPFEIKKSNKLPTTPQSPPFSTKLRSAHKSFEC